MHGLEPSRTAGMQSWNSSRSRRNQGAAAEADAIREQLTIREQQLKQTQAATAAEADTNGQHQLMQIDEIEELQLNRTQLGSRSSAHRAVRHRITHIGERGVRATCIDQHWNNNFL